MMGMGGDVTAGYRWSVRVTQVDCTEAGDRKLVAPPGCTQFHTATAGRLASFNLARVGELRQYQHNLRYTVCLARPPAACQVQYTRDTSLPKYRMSVGKVRHKLNIEFKISSSSVINIVSFVPYR